MGERLLLLPSAVTPEPFGTGENGGSVRIWFQKHTVTGRVAGLDEAYEAHMARVARSDTQVEFRGLPPETYQGPLPEGLVRYGGIEDLFGGYFAAQAVRASDEGFDAYIIGTSQDPGLVAARGLVEIPVVAYGETALHVASMLAPRFGVVGFIPELEEPIRDNAARYGLNARLVACTYTRTGPEQVHAALQGQSGPFLDAFREAARTAIAAGAQVLIPGEGLPNEILVREEITDIDRVPVLDPDGLLIKFAELFVEARVLGLVPPVTSGYRGRRPAPDQLHHLLGIYGPRSGSV